MGYNDMNQIKTFNMDYNHMNETNTNIQDGI